MSFAFAVPTAKPITVSPPPFDKPESKRISPPITASRQGSGSPAPSQVIDLRSDEDGDVSMQEKEEDIDHRLIAAQPDT